MISLKVGDVVQLKSSGPKMTVSRLNKKDNTVGCCWFNSKKVESSNIPAVTITIESETEHYDGIDEYGN